MWFSSFGLDRGPVQYQIWPHNCSTHKMRSAREEFRRKFKILWIKIICLITKLTLTKINIQSTKPCCQPEKPVAPATFFFFGKKGINHSSVDRYSVEKLLWVYISNNVRLHGKKKNFARNLPFFVNFWEPLIMIYNASYLAIFCAGKPRLVSAIWGDDFFSE